MDINENGLNNNAISVATVCFTDGAQLEKSIVRLQTFHMVRLCIGKSE